MKLSLTFVLCFSVSILISQKKVDLESLKYSRSSLHTIMLEIPDMQFKEVVTDAYSNAPFPDKYNNHQLEEKSFNPKKYTITNEERLEAGLKPVKESRELDSLLRIRAEEMPLRIEKYFEEEQIANKLVAKWFNRKENGTFDMNLIAERGLYNASEMELEIAKGKATGIASIRDAGEELINNTFVVVSQSAFLENEIVASAIRTSAYIVAETLGGYAESIAKITADIAYKATKDGYSVFTDAHLYKLRWNDSIASVFYTEYWIDKSSINPERKANFEKSKIFKLDYIGSEKSRTVVTMWNNNSKKNKKNKKQSRKERKTNTSDGYVNTNEEYIALATVRNLNKVIVELQKRHDIFKTKTPIISVDPITAKIGTKEGLNGGEKFEVFEQYIDPDTGRTNFKKKGVIKVDKKNIWDNQFAKVDSIQKNESSITSTHFKNGKQDMLPGMLIRQIK